MTFPFFAASSPGVSRASVLRIGMLRYGSARTALQSEQSGDHAASCKSPPNATDWFISLAVDAHSNNCVVRANGNAGERPRQ
jgi:hypothetical protein